MSGGWVRAGGAWFWPTCLDQWRGQAGSWAEGGPRERVCFLFLSTLDKSLSNDIPQMSLMMCVANSRLFFFFFWSFLKTSL